MQGDGQGQDKAPQLGKRAHSSSSRTQSVLEETTRGTAVECSAGLAGWHMHAQERIKKMHLIR